jgi:hypothetical protein
MEALRAVVEEKGLRLVECKKRLSRDDPRERIAQFELTKNVAARTKDTVVYSLDPAYLVMTIAESMDEVDEINNNDKLATRLRGLSVNDQTFVSLFYKNSINCGRMDSYDDNRDMRRWLDNTDGKAVMCIACYDWFEENITKCGQCQTPLCNVCREKVRATTPGPHYNCPGCRLEMI